MKILFISKNLAEITLAHKLTAEGHKIRLFEREPCWKNKINRPPIKFVYDWQKELSWVGRDGLIVFDDIGMGEIQDKLRADGFSVFGGSGAGEQLEENRHLGQEVFKSVGMATKDCLHFKDIDKLIGFIKKNPKRWVIKQNGHMDKGLNYVGRMQNGADCISLLKSYKKNLKTPTMSLDIQEVIDGIELAAGRFFNGNDWTGPICLNIEHKNLFNKNLGPKTAEMGNLMWYEEDESNRFFQATLGRMKNYLKGINYHGYFDINCIVTKECAYPLEATCRLGHPTTQIQDTLNLSPWGQFLKAVADGENYALTYRKGCAVIVFIGTPPYPYANRSNQNSPKNLQIFFEENISKNELDRIYLEEVSIVKQGDGFKYMISGNSGYICFVSGFGKTVNDARQHAYQLVDKIIIPKMFYRNDIGLSFVKNDSETLKEWRWI